MTKIITEPPDRRTVYPWNEHEPLLSWYGGAFDAAFIALHPFRYVLDVGPHARTFLESVGHAPIPDDAYQAMIELYRYGRSHYASWPEIERLEMRYAAPVTWESVRQGTGFSDLAAVNHALLSGIWALRPQYADPAGSEQLDLYCERHGLLEPSEGSFPHLMQLAIADLFAKAGFQDVETGNEFGEEVRPLSVAALRGKEGWRPPETADRGSLFVPDRSLLCAVHWDSYFTLITGTRDRLAAADPASLLEGFWCTPTTEHHWWKERAGWAPPPTTEPR